MKNLKTADIPRILLGLLLVFVGSNKVFQFMPMPEMPVVASTFMGAIVSAGFLLLKKHQYIQRKCNSRK